MFSLERERNDEIWLFGFLASHPPKPDNTLFFTHTPFAVSRPRSTPIHTHSLSLSPKATLECHYTSDPCVIWAGLQFLFMYAALLCLSLVYTLTHNTHSITFNMDHIIVSLDCDAINSVP